MNALACGQQEKNGKEIASDVGVCCQARAHMAGRGRVGQKQSEGIVNAVPMWNCESPFAQVLLSFPATRCFHRELFEVVSHDGRWTTPGSAVSTLNHVTLLSSNDREGEKGTEPSRSERGTTQPVPTCDYSWRGICTSGGAAVIPVMIITPRTVGPNCWHSPPVM
ncbi:unnamed protein product [Lota lota]